MTFDLCVLDFGICFNLGLAALLAESLWLSGIDDDEFGGYASAA